MRAAKMARLVPHIVRLPGLCLIALISLYRWVVSPLLGSNCRHLPTCSEYAAEAVRRFGAWRGGWLALSRLSRCHPWGSHGFDPVPEALEPRYGVLQAWRHGRWSKKDVRLGKTPHDERATLL